MPLEGRCNCGSITVAISDEIANTKPSIFCHCANCRRQSGALGTVVMIVPEDDAVVGGTPKLYEDKDTDSGKPVNRWFCGDCGSPVLSTTPLFPGVKIIKMGLFDNIPRPALEVYCKDKQVWEGQVDGTAQVHGAT